MTKRHRDAAILVWSCVLSIIPILVLAIIWLAGDGISEQARRMLGAFALAGQVVALIWTAFHVGRRWVAPDGLVDTVLSGAVVFLTVPACVVTMLGAVGLLTLPSVILMSSAVQIGLLAFLHHQDERHGVTPKSETARQPLSAGEWFLVSLCVVPYAILVLNALRYTLTSADELTYHLSIVAEWIRNQSTVPGPEILMPHRGYPAAREAILTWLALPLRSENVALLGAVELPLAWLVVYGLCRTFAVPRLLALAIACAFVTSPVVTRVVGGQKNDLFMALTFGMASFFLLRALRKQRAADAVLAGLAGGLMAAAKFSGLPYLAVLLAAYVATGVTCALRSPDPGRRDVANTFRLGMIAACVAVLVAAPWYLRNLIYLGNPVYPAQVSLMGHPLFDGPFDASLIQQTIVGPNVLRLVPYWHNLVETFGIAFPILLVAPFALALTWIVRRDRVSWRNAIWMICLPLALFVLFLFQPYSLREDRSSFVSFESRFLMIWAIAVQATIGAVFSRPGALVVAGAALAAVATIANVAEWTRYWWLAVLFAGIVSLTAGTVSRRIMPAMQRLRPAGQVILAVVMLVVGAVGLFWIDAFREAQKSDRIYGYASEKPRGHLSEYVRRHISHSTILCLGSSITFPLYGPKFTNRLVYLEQRDMESLRMYLWGHRSSNQYIPESLDIMRWIEEKRVDYVVGFLPILDRRGPGGKEYVFGPAPTVALRERFPDRFETVYSHEGEEVLRVIKSPR